MANIIFASITKRIPFTSRECYINNTNSGRINYINDSTKLPNVSWSSRSVLIGDMIFLTINYKDQGLKEAIVIYHGSAPSWHVPILSHLFPGITFILIEDENIILSIEPNDKIKLTTSVIDAINIVHDADPNVPIFYINNMGDNPYLNSTDKNIIPQHFVAKELYSKLMIDTILQILIKSNIKISHCWLRLSVPYSATNINYYLGSIFFLPWNGQSSTVLKLNVNASNMNYANINAKEIEQWCSYHNKIKRRPNCYFNVIDKSNRPNYSNELLNDFDSSCEAWILARYLYGKDPIASQEEILDGIGILCSNITIMLDQGTIATRRVVMDNMIVNKNDDIFGNGEPKYPFRNAAPINQPLEIIKVINMDSSITSSKLEGSLIPVTSTIFSVMNSQISDSLTGKVE